MFRELSGKYYLALNSDDLKGQFQMNFLVLETDSIIQDEIYNFIKRTIGVFTVLLA